MKARHIMNRSSIMLKVVDMIKTSDYMQPLYKRIKTRQNRKKFRLDTIKVFHPEVSEFTGFRFNLVLPTLRKTKVFAGISSALTFFSNLTKENDLCRIIVISDEMYDAKMTYSVPGYIHETKGNKQVVFASDSDIISVGINDFFVFTSWKTAFSFKPILKWQQKQFCIPNRKAVYLIQDYEPGFFPWSSEYALAESTYLDAPDDIIAVFNSKELKNFFSKKEYEFAGSCFFEPILNEELKRKLLKNDWTKPSKREKRILIYGRPNEPRNAFEIVRFALSVWSKEYRLSREWEIISLGESFTDIKLDNNTIVSKGKVSLDEYADYMLSSYAAISLMISPHPSYPPLEMSTFGVRTITNMFREKDLGNFNDNIISLDKCSPQLLVSELTRICEEYDKYESRISCNEEYLSGSGIGGVAKEVRTVIID